MNDIMKIIKPLEETLTRNLSKTINKDAKE